MQPRLKYRESSPEGFAAMRQFNAYVESCGIEHSLLELVKMSIADQRLRLLPRHA